MTMPESIFSRMRHLYTHTSAMEYELAGELFALYAYLFKDSQSGNTHIRRVENYIRSNYMHHIRVEHIAAELNLDRRYLSRCFKEKTGQSIQEYLIRVRLEESHRLLLQGYSVKEAAVLSGYEDAANYSKMFKKHFGKPPASFKK
jgi:AraC-like DNA-binding protein